MQLVGTDIAAIDQVEDLQEDERVPNQREVLPLRLGQWVVSVDDLGGQVVIKIENALATVHNDHHDCNHVDRHTEDLAIHVRGHESALAGAKVNEIGLWSSGSKSQRAKDVHDQVDVDELDGVQCTLSKGDIADDHDNENGEVCRDLELKEALHIHVDVTAPHDGAHARVKIVGLKHH